MRIDEIRKIYASLLYATAPEKRTDIGIDAESAAQTAEKRDSYIPSVSGSEPLQSTGNYDDQGLMDDDFSIPVGNDNRVQAAQYSREYAQQTVQTVTESETPDGGMSRPQG